MRNSYVYIHKRLDTNDVFYVGKGSGPRHKVKSGRSREWKQVVDDFGYISEILIGDISEELAYFVEAAVVHHYISKGILLCNKTVGGGPRLSNPSEETRGKQRKAKLGKKQSKEHAIKSALSKVGKKQPRSAVDYVIGLKKKKVINSKGEVFESSTIAANEMAKRTNTSVSQGNISTCCRGEKRSAYGLNWSYNINSIPELKPITRKVFNLTTGEAFESLRLACNKYGLKTQSISFAARNNTMSGGFKWSYKDED